MSKKSCNYSNRKGIIIFVINSSTLEMKPFYSELKLAIYITNS